MRVVAKLRVVLLVIVLGFVAFVTPTQASALSAADFIARTYQWAQAEEREHGVPASVAMAQSMLESGMGESELARNANNWFGIKCSSTPSPNQDGCYAINTWEVDENGNRYTVRADFRSYSDPEKSFIDHGRFLSTLSRYSAAFDYSDDPDRFIFEVHQGGYATDPLYANKVIDLMQRHNLYQYNVTPPASRASELVIRPAARANVGATANVTGLLSPGGGGRTVWTQALTPGGWSTSRSTTTSARGHFAIPLTYGADHVGVHRFRVQVAGPQGTITSQEFTIERLGALRAEAVQTVNVGETARLRGTAEGYSGRTVTAQIRSGNSWRNHSTATVASDGSFDLALTGQTGTARVRATLTTPSGTRITSNEVSAAWRQEVNVSAHSAGSKPAGQETNTWGTATGAPNSEVWTEVRLASGWSRSQVRTTDARGGFVIPLTYGANQPGAYEWRVGVRSSGGVDYSPTFTLERTRASVSVSASSAGSKPIRQQTNVWGTASGASRSEVWTEVQLPSGWSRSQARTTDANGGYIIPLTYGNDRPGTHRWRVGVRTSEGVFYSGEFNLTRVR